MGNICILNVRLGGETDQQNVMRKTYLNIFVKAFAQEQKCSSKELTLHVCYMYAYDNACDYDNTSDYDYTYKCFWL